MITWIDHACLPLVPNKTTWHLWQYGWHDTEISLSRSSFRSRVMSTHVKNLPGNRAQQGYQNLVFYHSLDISDIAYDKSTHGQCKTAQ